MSIRFGYYTLYPGIFFLAAAALFYLVLFWRMLRHGGTPEKAAYFVITVSSAAAFAGAMALGLAVATRPRAGIISLPLASLGGYWGLILGAACAASMAKRPPGQVVRMAVVPMLTGGMIARIGCLYTNCCPGADFLPLASLWPVLDAAALGVTLLTIRFRPRLHPLAKFMVVYGSLRLVAEMLRADAGFAVLIILVVQVLLGCVLVAFGAVVRGSSDRLSAAARHLPR